MVPQGPRGEVRTTRPGSSATTHARPRRRAGMRRRRTRRHRSCTSRFAVSRPPGSLRSARLQSKARGRAPIGQVELVRLIWGSEHRHRPRDRVSRTARVDAHVRGCFARIGLRLMRRGAGERRPGGRQEDGCCKGAADGEHGETSLREIGCAAARQQGSNGELSCRLTSLCCRVLVAIRSARIGTCGRCQHPETREQPTVASCCSRRAALGEVDLWRRG
jgi:hypothetical protein